MQIFYACAKINAMSTITEITSQKKGDRLNVFLDGQFAFGVEYTTAVKFGLKVGKELGESDIAAIDEEEGNTAAFNRGLKYSVKKTVSRRQMKDYLVRNGFSVTAADAAIDKLGEYGYVDDEKFAYSYVATYGSERGAKRMEFELRSAGVSAEIIARALETTDESACEKCLNKYMRTHKGIDRNKLVNYLVYRGFDWDEIIECLSRSGI